MKHEKFIWGFILASASVLLLYFSPDTLSLGFLAGMVILTVYGFVVGILRVFRFCENFKTARKSIERARKVQTSSPWNVLKENDNVFGNELLDEEFKDYAVKVCGQNDALDEAVYLIEDQINSDLIEGYSNNTVVSQIPGILTSLGILGTFIGLLYGLNFISFTSVDTAIVTIETMLGGIRVAFYTSIAGVILSIVFNWCYHRVWQKLEKEIRLFYNDFHRYVIPSAEERNRKLELEYRRKMLILVQQLSDKKAKNDKTEV